MSPPCHRWAPSIPRAPLRRAEGCEARMGRGCPCRRRLDNNKNKEIKIKWIEWQPVFPAAGRGFAQRTRGGRQIEGFFGCQEVLALGSGGSGARCRFCRCHWRELPHAAFEAFVQNEGAGGSEGGFGGKHRPRTRFVCAETGRRSWCSWRPGSGAGGTWGRGAQAEKGAAGVCRVWAGFGVFGHPPAGEPPPCPAVSGLKIK